MIVLLDLEWVKNGKLHLTQLSAVRTDENWNPAGSLEIFVNPGEECCRQPKHVAFGGVGMEVYRNAFPEDDCLRDFADWLEAGDEIWVWARSNRGVFLDLWRKYGPEREVPMIRSTAQKARSLAKMDGRSGPSSYSILTAYGVTPAHPEHRAANDTEAMRRLFLCLGMSPDSFAQAAPETPRITAPVRKASQRELNRKIIDRTEYNYVYLKGSGVFHKKTCRACLAAKSEASILGSVYYETAAKGRRPCRICHPVPTADASRKMRRQGKAPEQRPPVAQSTDLVVPVRLLTGEVIWIYPANVIGWCHNAIHRGALNRSLLKKHDCLGKDCRYLEQNCQCSFWEGLRKKEQEKAARKKALKEKKAQLEAEENQLRILSENWQSYLEDMGSDMHIVRVEKETPSVFKIFYVSGNRFADGNRYPDFLETLKWLHPHCRIILRHIRDVDGHFVTTEE